MGMQTHRRICFVRSSPSGRVTFRRLLAALLSATVLAAAATRSQDTGYPDDRYPPPPRIGQWPSLQMGVFTPFGSDLLSTNTYWELEHANSWHDLYIRGSSGTLYLVSKSVSRRNPADPFTLPFAISLKSSPSGLVVNICDRSWTGEPTEELTADDHVKRTVTNVTGETEVITFGPERFTWKSQDANYINVTGTPASPGTMWMLPWREPNGATDRMFYLANYYKVEGTYCGEKIIDGHAQMENAWSNPGYPATWWVQNRAGHWATWTNEYADGSRESGQFLCGQYGARGGVIVDGEGKVLLNTPEVNAFDNGNGRRIRYQFGNGEKWVFIADPTERFAFGSTIIGNGVFKRVGDQRKIVRHSATHLLVGKLCDPMKFADRRSNENQQ